jgi:predicted secreted protein
LQRIAANSTIALSFVRACQHSATPMCKVNRQFNTCACSRAACVRRARTGGKITCWNNALAALALG